ncbi:DUF6318 family protein [Nesterenkonia cremea]|uniref:DUF6318 family protein n=1 Tax=Nesterenkonia cremea TaxID=1882340 RepID=UPI00166B4EF4|nr:DUF6318 family protein [Nesterenkonia cremea]
MTGAMAAGVLVAGLTGCGDDAEAGTAEESGAAEGTDAPVGEENADGDADAGGEGAAGEAEEPEPLPASSEGPAENWPEPEVPEEASEQTEEGVEAALQYWFETRQYARNTGDTAPLEAASTANCALCAQQVERVEEAYENGWYVQEEDVVHQAFLTLDGDDVASGLFTLNQGAYAGYWDGELVGEVEALEERPWTVALAYVDGRWLVADLLFAGDDGDEEQL